MIKGQTKAYIKTQLKNYLEQQGINTNKHFTCLSPDHIDDKPSMSYDSKRYKVHCFACGVDLDVFDLVAIEYGFLSSNKEVFIKAQELFNIDSCTRYSDLLEIKQDNTVSTVEVVDYSAYFEEVAGNIGNTDYPKQRGLSLSTIERYKLGFDANFTVWQRGQKVSWQALIIPTSKSSYLARNTNLKTSDDNRIRKIGGSPLFNTEVLNSHQSVFIVEGEIDALSIMEVGGRAVALGSLSNIRRFVDYVSNLKLLGVLLLALDNDEQGKKAITKLINGLEEIDIDVKVVDIYQGCKDANEALVTDRLNFEQLVQRVLSDTNAPISQLDYLSNNVANCLAEFKYRIHHPLNSFFIPTDFKKLDQALDGGLFEGLYVIGAISSLGKTTLTTQLADQIASQGFDVLYISLEMSRHEIMAKSISRHTLLCSEDQSCNASKAKTARDIVVGAKYASYSKQELEVIEQAEAAYEKYTKHLYVVEGSGLIGTAEIRNLLTEHQKQVGTIPAVIIDYLQILAPENAKFTDKQNVDRVVLELKRLSRDFHTPVIAISSFNRQNYREAVTMEAFKESGAIEYSSDVLLGLQFRGTGDKDFDLDAAKFNNPRKVELKILKNRSGRAGDCLTLDYYPSFNFFVEQ